MNACTQTIMKVMQCITIMSAYNGLVPLAVAEAVKSVVAIDELQLSGQSTTITSARYSN